jgi:hypothetical protein
LALNINQSIFIFQVLGEDMNLFAVIISALFQFCLGLGWYDGHSYYLFSNKYLKKHKPINTYSSGFSLWKPQNFWRKRRIPEPEANYRSIDVLPFERLPARKRFLQYSPYFPRYFGKNRTRPKERTNKNKSRSKFNSFNYNVYSNNINRNTFVRRNIHRPPYFPFYFKSPSMYLSHYNDLGGHMHSGTSENKYIFVNRNKQLSRKPLSGSSFGILSSKLEKPIDLDNSIKYSDKNQRKNEKIDDVINPGTILEIEDSKLSRKVTFMPGNIDNIDISLEPGSFSGANVQGRNDENDNDGHFDVRLPLNSDRDDSGFHRKEFVKASDSKGTLSDESFHSLKKYPVAPDGFKSNNVGTFEQEHDNYNSNLEFKNFGTIDKGGSTRTNHQDLLVGPHSNNNDFNLNNYGPKEEFSGFQSAIVPKEAIYQPSKVQFHNKPLDFSNQESEALHTNRDFGNGFSSNVDNSGFQNEEGGFFVDIAEEGSFNNDQVCSV